MVYGRISEVLAIGIDQDTTVAAEIEEPNIRTTTYRLCLNQSAVIEQAIADCQAASAA